MVIRLDWLPGSFGRSYPANSIESMLSVIIMIAPTEGGA